MSENDRKKTARRVNPESPWRYLLAEFFNYLLELLEKHTESCTPPILRGGVYTAAQVIRGLKLSKHTLERWQQAGLRCWKGGGKRPFFRGEDVLDFMAGDEPLPPAYKSPHAKRNADRNKKGA